MVDIVIKIQIRVRSAIIMKQCFAAIIADSSLNWKLKLFKLLWKKVIFSAVKLIIFSSLS